MVAGRGGSCLLVATKARDSAGRVGTDQRLTLKYCANIICNLYFLTNILRKKPSMPKLLSNVALFSVSLLLGAVGGCGGKSASYGASTAPTGSQMQAVSSLTQVGTEVSVAAKGMSDANKVFGVQSLMASLQGTAINQSSSTSGLSLFASEIDASCTTGSAATGFTYNNCTTENGTISGSVKITPSSVEYDLKITASGSGTNTELTLIGSVSVSGGRITGDLEYKIHVDLGALGGLGGLGGSAANPDVVTKAIFDMTYTEEPACITDGTVEVTVDYAGMFRAAKFTFTGCNSVMVQNGS